MNFERRVEVNSVQVLNFKEFKMLKKFPEF